MNWKPTRTSEARGSRGVTLDVEEGTEVEIGQVTPD